MNSDSKFYICPICFKTSELPGTHHGRDMVHCDPRSQGQELCKPAMDADGRVLNPAPLWFLKGSTTDAI